MKNSRLKAMFSISQSYVSLEFLIKKSLSRPIPIFLAISHEITQKFANFSLKITKNRKGCHSRILWLPQMVLREMSVSPFA